MSGALRIRRGDFTVTSPGNVRLRAELTGPFLGGTVHPPGELTISPVGCPIIIIR